MKTRKVIMILIIFLLISLQDSYIISAGSEEQTLYWEHVMDSNDLFDLASNNEGIIVAVGQCGTIKTYSESTGFKRVESGTGEDLESIVYNNDFFVAVGEFGVILISENGYDWNAVNYNDDIFYNNIIWDGNELIACGIWFDEYIPKLVISKSKDGYQWNEKKIDYDFYPFNIAYNNNNFILNSDNEIILTQDFENFISVNKVDEVINDLIWSGTKYIASGHEGSVYTSTDGYTWISNRLSDTPIWETVSYNNLDYVLYKYQNKISVYENQFRDIIKEISVNDISKLLITDDKTIYAISNDFNLIRFNNTEWEALSDFYNKNIWEILWDGNRFVALAYKNILISNNGLDWDVYDIDYELTNIIYDGRNYVGTYNNKIYTSIDSLKWQFKTEVEIDIDDLFFVNNSYIISEWDGKKYLSSNLEEWKGTNLEQITYDINGNGDEYVSVGLHGSLYTSADGLDWKVVDLGIKNHLESITYTGEYFVIVGEAITIKYINGEFELINYHYNKDLVTWDGQRCIMYDGYGFHNVFFSYNGLENIHIGNINSAADYDLVWNGYRYIVVGINGHIATTVPKDIIKVLVNNTPVVFDIAPVIEDNRILIPLRSVSEIVRCEVTWNDMTKTVVCKNDGIEVNLKINSTKAYVNNQEVILDVAATTKNGRIFVPLRFFCDAFGASIEWIDDDQTINIKLD